ncbi:MAG: OB-fold nucleic acid binding domain protein [Microcystis novacekii Mn_MB_F_20050700_S1]|uniref:OB-fold nucleic acid binding domain protein n=1 Tax=Microcystis novacekii Mn_MB_F_20050700_S1D TaxID=2486266 RepID=A0A552IPH5_9CHRO|nr:MAG: OB-fold nucleic acid binding domain protein [Microcystis novacekii Mn_MB_F_20050700_S1D]TRU88172.1 MAG: OB-fold nucleic acid binding domain protein [Microcystis novacekii Mn_MB_F_20050700_S1]
MSIQTRVGRIGSLLLLLGLFGCSTLADLGIAVPYIGTPPLTAIEQLQEKPKGTLVYLRGTVSNYAPFLTGGAYLLQDGSGKIWIRTNSNKLPRQGQEIVIKGKIDFEAIPQGSQTVNEMYVLELEQMDAVAVNSVPTPSPTSEVKPPENNSPPVSTKPLENPRQVTIPSAAETKPPETPVVTPVKPNPPTQPVAEAIPPKPPTVIKPKPVQDPLDAFFLPHKQREKNSNQ